LTSIPTPYLQGIALFACRHLQLFETLETARAVLMIKWRSSRCPISSNSRDWQANTKQPWSPSLTPAPRASS